MEHFQQHHSLHTQSPSLHSADLQTGLLFRRYQFVTVITQGRSALGTRFEYSTLETQYLSVRVERLLLSGDMGQYSAESHGSMH